jgi:hypothetical protein
LSCFCFNQLKAIQFGIKELKFPDDQKKCYDWFTKFAFSNSMALVTAAVVEIVNEIVVLILVWTSKF